MGLLEDLEKKYGVAAPARDGSELEQLEARYGVVRPPPAAVRGLQTGDAPSAPEKGIEGVPPALQAGAAASEAAATGTSAPAERGPVHDPAMDYWGLADRLVAGMNGDGGRDYTDSTRRTAYLINKLDSAPDDEVMFEAPRGPVTAGHMRAVKETSDLVRSTAAGAAIGGPIARTIGAALPVGGSAVTQVAKHAIAAGGGAAAGQAAGDVATDVPAEEIPRRALQTGVVGAGLGVAMKVSSDVLNEATEVAARLRARQAFEDTSIGASKRQKAQLYSKEAQVTQAIGEHGLTDVTDKAAKLKPAAAEKLRAVGEAIGNVDKRVTEASGGMPITKVMRAIDKVAQEYERPGSHEIASKLQKIAEEVRGDWKDKFPVVDSVTRVPLSEVRQLSSRLGETAFAGDASVPAKTAVRAQKQLYGAIRDELTSHIDQTMERAPALRKELGDVDKLERDYASLKLIKDVAATRAPQERFAGQSRFSSIMNEAGNKGATGLGLGLTAVKAVGGAGARTMARALAALSDKAAAGTATYDDIAAAVQLGIPREVVDRVVRQRQSPARLDGTP